MAAMMNGINQYYKTYALYQSGSSNNNSMAELLKIGSASAVYNQNYVKQYDAKLSDYFNALTKNTYLFKAATDSIQYNNSDSSLNKKAVTVSSSDHAIVGTATSRAEIKDYTINVISLADKQVNTSNKFVSTEAATNTGINTFSIYSDSGVSKNMSFTVEQGDTNKISLNKMAKAINASDSGLKATVVDDVKEGTSYLQVEGKIGQKNKFELEDIKGTAVTTTGVSKITTEAKNGELTVDGKKYTTEDNTVKLNNGTIILSLNKAEGKDIKVSIKPDINAAMRGIKELVSSYNSMIDFSVRYSTELSGAGTLKGELSGVVNAKKASLETIGITMNKDSKLEIDDRKLSDSLKGHFSKVRELIGGKSGIADRLERKSNEILANQYQYAEPKQLNPTYTDTSNYFLPNNKMPYLQNLNLGYFLNYMV